MLLVISSHRPLNYSRLPDFIAGSLAQALQRAQVNELILLIGLIFVVAIVDIIMTGALPKWAILARSSFRSHANGVAPQTVWPPTASAIRPSTSSPR